MDWKLQRARRCNRPLVPARAASTPFCRLCRGARDPNGATGGCDGPEAARHVAARRSVPRPADGTRGRSDGNHVSTLVSSPSWCVSSAAGSSDNHARCSVFSPSLSISLCLSFSPPASPSPPSPAPPFYRAFFIFFLPVGFPPPSFTFLRTAGISGGGRPRRARDVRVPRSWRSCYPSRGVMLPRDDSPRVPCAP